MQNILRRISILTALLIGVLFAWWQAAWRFVLPNWPHPSIKHYSPLTLDATDLRARVEAGEPFTIKLGDRRVTLHLESTSILGDECTVIELTENGRRELEPPAVTTFRGHVAETDGTAAVSIGKDSVSGVVVLADGWWVIEPAIHYRRGAVPNEHIVYRMDDIQFFLEFGDDAIPTQSYRGGEIDHHNDNNDEHGDTGDTRSETDGGRDLPSAETKGRELHPPDEHIETVGIICVADREFVDQSEQLTDRTWPERQQELIFVVNEIFRREFGREFRIGHFITDQHSQAGRLYSTNSQALLAQLEIVILTVFGDLRSPTTRSGLGVEVAHLMTGKNLDDVLGRAWEPGVYGLTQYRLPQSHLILNKFLELFKPPIFVGSMLTVAHELGHNFNGVHEEADIWCTAQLFDSICVDWGLTIMYPGRREIKVRQFSDGTRNAARNNKRRIRVNLESGRNKYL
jgi:hypothetical protein